MTIGRFQIVREWIKRWGGIRPDVIRLLQRRLTEFALDRPDEDDDGADL